jgi:hypothetical protein
VESNRHKSVNVWIWANYCTWSLLTNGDGMPGGWDPSEESDNSKSGQVKHYMDLEHWPHWLHLEPTHLLGLS